MHLQSFIHHGPPRDMVEANSELKERDCVCVCVCVCVRERERERDESRKGLS